MSRYLSIIPQTVEYAGVQMTGVSIAGIGTCIVLPQYKLAFDVAQGLPHAFNAQNFLITHPHMDHASGIPYLISQKALTQQKAPRFYMPPYMVQPMTQIIDLWESIEGYKYNYEFIPLEKETYVELNPKFGIKAFPVHHRVEAQGYTLFQKNKKLKVQYKNLNSHQIRDLRKTGVTVEEEFQTPLVSFTGDTKIEFLDSDNWVKDSRVLLMEVTYGGTKKSVQSAREWGHIHMDEVADRLKNVSSEKIVFIHQSSRYKLAEFKELLKKSFSSSELDRIEIFPRGEEVSYIPGLS